MYMGAPLLRRSRSGPAGTYKTGQLGAEIGPLTSCPPGHVVTRTGKGQYIGKVWCRPELRAAKPVASAPAPTPVTQVTVNPNIQTQVSPQISPIFQQTGQGSQSAGTTMTSPGGQVAPGGGSDLDSFMRLMAERDARAAEQARLDRVAREAEEKRRWEAQQAQYKAERDAREQRLAEQAARDAEERAAIKAAQEEAVSLPGDGGGGGFIPGGVAAPAPGAVSEAAPDSAPFSVWLPVAVIAGVTGLYIWRRQRA